MITIIDYGAGNIKSIKNMLKKIGIESQISRDAEELKKADKLILPGVGHFDHGMRNLHHAGIVEVLNEKVLNEKTPILGICLGAQLLGNQSEEGVEKGLAWIDMDVVRFDPSKLSDRQKIPHMGWNYIERKKDSKLMEGLNDDSRFYFVHEFHMKVKTAKDELLSTHYGYEFTSAVERGTIFGTQFHPEKSHKFGMQLLTNFSKI